MTTKKIQPTEPPTDTEKETPAEIALFRNLGHPLRRKIIRFVSERGRVNYSDLRDTFHIEPGTIYFHLEQLMTPDGPLIEQTKERIYQITSLGRLAATFLNQATDITPSAAPPSTSQRHPRLRRLTYYLGLTPLFRYLTTRRDHLILESIITLGALAYLFSLVPLILVGFLPLDLYVLFIYLPALTFLASWFLITLTTEGIARFRYQSTEGFRALFAATVYAWLPLGLYALILLLNAPLLNAIPVLSFLLLFICITWTLWIYTQAVIHTKRIAMRKAALTTIIITNVTLIASLALLLLMLFP